jgi:hypothetical protein
MNDLVEAVHYGLNNGTPTLKMPIPEQPFSARNADDFYVPIDTEDTYVSLQVTFVDGTKSKVVKIYRE